ncbi:MAG: type II toxin-antitoxin system VapC family toxin [Candidatus Limnocylindria bacterium]
MTVPRSWTTWRGPLLLVDVNVLVYAHAQDAPRHAEHRDWLRRMIESESAYGVSDLVLSGFLRVVTNPRVFDAPMPIERALTAAEVLRSRPNAVLVSPAERHWEIFGRLCRETGVKGNLVPDAYFAALAIESGSEWITTDRDYARFPGLRWRHPLD